MTTSTLELQPGENLALDSGGWVSRDADRYVAFDAAGGVKGSAADLQQAIDIAEGRKPKAPVRQAAPPARPRSQTQPGEVMPPTNQQPATSSKADAAAALNAERAAIEEKLSALRANPSPEVADLLRKADAAVAGYRQQAATLEAELAGIDAELGVRERDRRAAGEQRRARELAATREQLVNAVERHLDAVSLAQGHLKAFVDALNEVFARHGEVRTAAVKISAGARLPSGFSEGDLIKRITGGVAGTLGTIKVPGAFPGVTQRVGSIELPRHSLYPASQVWRNREEHIITPAVQQLIGK